MSKKNPQIKIGFELEFASFYTRKEIASVLKQVYCGADVDCPKAQHTRQSDPKHFHVTNDCSIVSNRFYVETEQQIEIATPVWTYAYGINQLKRLFGLIALFDGETNFSTGLHVNMSFQSKTIVLDLESLILLVEEEKVLRKFKRLSNFNCQSYQKRYSKLLKPLIEKKRSSVAEIKNKIKYDWYKQDKCRSINLSKYNTKRYIEFRMIGGKDYHRRYEEIVEVIEHFKECMIQSSNTIQSVQLAANNRKILKNLRNQTKKVSKKYAKSK